MFTLVTANLLKYGGSSTLEERQRFAAVERMLRTIDADVIAVQEVMAPRHATRWRRFLPPTWPRRSAGALCTPGSAWERSAAEHTVRRLAAAIGRNCEVAGRPVLAVGGDRHHVALLWRDGIEVVPDSVTRYGRPDGMWHALITAVFVIDGRLVRVGVVHLPVFDPGLSWGWHDAGQVLRALNRHDGIPGLVGGDWNGLGACENYDPNPYLGVPWHPAHAYHLDHHGAPDRHAAIRLERHGGLRDCARLLGVDWAPTTGRHPTDHQPPRRVDRWYATHDLPAAAVRDVHVVGADLVGKCTDHDPVVVRIDPSALDHQRGRAA